MYIKTSSSDLGVSGHANLLKGVGQAPSSSPSENFD